MADNKIDTTLTEWRQNWTVVAAAMLGMALMAVPTYSVGVMIGPLEQEFGWTRAQISSGLPVVSVMAVALTTIMGLGMDKLGPRRIGIVATCLMTAAIALLSFAPPSLWLWLVLWALIGVAAAMSPTVWPAAVSTLFISGRGLALGITLSGSGLTATLVPILALFFLEHYGWRGVYLGLAAFWGLASLPLIIFCFRSASDTQQIKVSSQPASPPPALIGPTAREGFASINFLKLAMASVAISVPGVALVVNLVPMMHSTGLQLSTAAAIAGILGIASITGRVLGGLLLDRISAKSIVVGVTLATGFFPIMLLLFPGSAFAAAAGVLVFGLSVGGKLGAMAYLASRYFGTRSFGALYGTMMALIGLGAGIGPMLANLIYDKTHSYEIVLWATLPILALAALIFLSLGRYPDFSTQDPEDKI